MHRVEVTLFSLVFDSEQFGTVPSSNSRAIAVLTLPYFHMCSQSFLARGIQKINMFFSNVPCVVSIFSTYNH